MGIKVKTFSIVLYILQEIMSIFH